MARLTLPAPTRPVLRAMAVAVLATAAALAAVAAQAAASTAPATVAAAAPAAASAPAAAAPVPTTTALPPATGAEATSPATGLVLVDQAALRAAPRDAAPLLVPLWRGEALQLRATRGDWLQVWDAHRERGGFVRAAQVLPLPAGEAALPDLAAQLRLLRQQPGAEALGTGVAAALIERAPAPWLASAAGAELLDSLVLLQERLAQRVQSAGPGQQAAAAAHAEVAARYGFALRQVARSDGSQQPCPALRPAELLRGHPAASTAQQARAALALTRGDCISADLLPSQRLALLLQHAAWLDGIALPALAPVERNRLLLRRASVLASLAFARRDGAEARSAATAAFAAWAQVLPADLADDDAPAVREAAVRLSPQRWLLQPAASARQLGRFSLTLERGGPGETCLVVIGTSASTRPAPAGASAQPQPSPVRHCTHGAVHLASASLAPDGSALALQVQALDGWTVLWRLDAAGRLQVLPPASDAPGLGTVEAAGWLTTKDSTKDSTKDGTKDGTKNGTQDGAQLLVAREAEAGGRSLRRFEVYAADLAQPLRWAGDPALLGAFQRAADPGWRGLSTLAR